MSERVNRAAKALARRGLSALGKERFDADLGYYQNQFGSSEREEFEQAARAAIDAADDASEFRIAKLELGPRDVLVVKTAYHIAREVVERIRLTLADDAGLTNKIMVIGPDLDLAVLTRSEIEERIAPQSEDEA